MREHAGGQHLDFVTPSFSPNRSKLEWFSPCLKSIFYTCPFALMSNNSNYPNHYHYMLALTWFKCPYYSLGHMRFSHGWIAPQMRRTSNFKLNYTNLNFNEWLPLKSNFSFWKRPYVALIGVRNSYSSVRIWLQSVNRIVWVIKSVSSLKRSLECITTRKWRLNHTGNLMPNLKRGPTSKCLFSLKTFFNDITNLNFVAVVTSANPASLVGNKSLSRQQCDRFLYIHKLYWLYRKTKKMWFLFLK